MFKLYKRWKEKKKKKLIGKTWVDNPILSTFTPEIVPVKAQIFSFDEAEGKQYVNGNPYAKERMNEHLAETIGRELLTRGLVDVEYSQSFIDNSLCITAWVEVIKR
jgi:hypothetical protein